MISESTEFEKPAHLLNELVMGNSILIQRLEEEIWSVVKSCEWIRSLRNESVVIEGDKGRTLGDSYI